MDYDIIVRLAWLLAGTGVGYLVQLVAARLRHGPEWIALPEGQRRAMAAVGAIAAFTAGTWVLDNPRPDPIVPFIWRLLQYQVLAAWLGSILLDAAARILYGPLLPRREERDDDER